MLTPRPVAIRLLATIILLLSAAPGAEAQRDRTVVGGQVGYARSWISTNSDAVNQASEDRQGAFVGLFVRTRILRWIQLQPEVDLTIKGGSFPVPSAPSGASTSFEFGYLEIPVLLRFAPSMTKNGQGFRPVVFAGASAGFELGCTLSTVSPADSLALSGCDDVLRSVEWSWLAGGGVQYNTAGVTLGLEGRYMQAFNSFLDSPLEPKNHLFAILLVLTI